MKHVRVGEISEQIRGVTYAKGDARDTPADGYVPLLRAGNIGEAGLITDDLVYVPAGMVSASQVLQPDDVLIATSSGSLSVVGKAARVTTSMHGTFGAFCKVLRPSSSVDPGYFAHFFRTREYRHHISSVAAGANINNLRSEDLKRLEIPAPPLSEQSRIAAILDHGLDMRAIVARRRQLLEMATASVFLAMFGRPTTNSQWERRTFHQVMQDVTSSAPKLPASQFTASGRWPIIDQSKKAIAGYSDDESMVTGAGDGLVVFGDHTRAAKLVLEPFILGADGAKVLAPAAGVTAPFLVELLRQSEIPNLGYSRHMRVLKSMSFPIPPVALQHLYAEKVAMVRETLDRLSAAECEIDALFASLQHRAFRGEL